MTDARKPYHHGNLTEELVATTIALIEEQGVETLSLRAVSRRLGISPAAPFRHFASKSALLAAVAEQAMARLIESTGKALADVGDGPPLAAMEAFGIAYLRWAADNPTHFKVISAHEAVDFAAVPSLVAANARLRSVMLDILRRAVRLGEIREDIDLDHLVLSLRAFAYGLARMRCDGHLSEWHPGEDADAAIAAALRQYLTLLSAR